MSFLFRLDLRLVALVLVVIAVDLYLGSKSVSGSEFSSQEAVFAEFENSPIRLFFPIVIALTAGSGLVAELAHHQVASTRTRVDIRQRLIRRFGVAALGAFTIFAGITVLNGVMGLVLAPSLWPDAVHSADYGLHSAAAISAHVIDEAPLAVLQQFGDSAFIAGAALWAGIHAAAFAVLTVCAVLLIQKPLLALLVPFALYVGQSIVLQVLGIPGPSFLISAIYPSGLQHYLLWQAALPGFLLVVVVLTGAGILVHRSRTTTRLS